MSSSTATISTPASRPDDPTPNTPQISSSFDIKKYVTHQRMLLDAERGSEMEQEQDRLEDADYRHDGSTLYNLVLDDAESNQHMYGKRLCVFITKQSALTQTPIQLPRHVITNRDPILIRPRFSHAMSSALSKEEKEGMEIQGVIYKVSPDSITVSLQSSSIHPHILNNGPIDLIKLRNDYLFKSLSKSLSSLETAIGDPLHCSRAVLDTIFLSTPPQFHTPHRSPLPTFANLNDIQKKSIEIGVKMPSVSILFGPPGTGKSTTLCEQLIQLVSYGKRVLFCASSNTAVDVVIERINAAPFGRVILREMKEDKNKSTLDQPLSLNKPNSSAQNIYDLERFNHPVYPPGTDPNSLPSRPLTAIRVGHPARLSQSVLKSSLDHLVQQETSAMNDDRKKLSSLTRQINKTYSNLNEHDTTKNSTFFYSKINEKEKKNWLPREVYQEFNQLRKDISTIEKTQAQTLLQQADIVACTLTGALSSVLDGFQFDILVIDECAQSTEISMIAAILKAKTLLIAGDHNQLPPTVMSPIAQENGLDITLMERLINLQRHSGADSRSTNENAKDIIEGMKNFNFLQKNAHKLTHLPPSIDLYPTIIMLKQQYRMTYSISNWASKALYHGMLTPSGPSVGFRSLDRFINFNKNNTSSLESYLQVSTSRLKMDGVDIAKICTEPSDDEYSLILSKPTKVLLHPFIVIDTAGDCFEDNDDITVNQPSTGTAGNPISGSSNATQNNPTGTAPSKQIKPKSSSGSRSNTGEIEYVFQHCKYLIANGIEPKNITVLSPYRAQVIKLQDYFRNLPFAEFQIDAKLIDVNTIDSIQGKENEVIIISLVRSNNNQSIGFLSEMRRLNVAITRAKCQVVLIGDCLTLENDAFINSAITDVNSLYLHHLDYLDIATGKRDDSGISGKRADNGKGSSAGKRTQKDNIKARLNVSAKSGLSSLHAMTQVTDQWNKKDSMWSEIVAQIGDTGVQTRSNRIETVFQDYINTHGSDWFAQSSPVFDSSDDVIKYCISSYLPLLMKNLGALISRSANDRSNNKNNELFVSILQSLQRSQAHTTDTEPEKDVASTSRDENVVDSLEAKLRDEYTVETLQRVHSAMKRDLESIRWRLTLAQVDTITSLSLAERKWIHNQVDDVYNGYYKSVMKNKAKELMEQREKDKQQSGSVKNSGVQTTNDENATTPRHHLTTNYNSIFFLSHMSHDPSEHDLDKDDIVQVINKENGIVDKKMTFMIGVELSLASQYVHKILQTVDLFIGRLTQVIQPQLPPQDPITTTKIELGQIYPEEGDGLPSTQDDSELDEDSDDDETDDTRPAESKQSKAKVVKSHQAALPSITYPIELSYGRTVIPVGIPSKSESTPPNNYTLKQFKGLIENHTGVLSSKQQLVCRGKKITDDKLLMMALAPLPAGIGAKSKPPIVQVIGVATQKVTCGPLVPVGADAVTTTTSTTSQTTTTVPTPVPAKASQPATKPSTTPTPTTKSNKKNKGRALGSTPVPAGSVSHHPLFSKVAPTTTPEQIQINTPQCSNTQNNAQADGVMTSNQLARMVYSTSISGANSAVDKFISEQPGGETKPKTQPSDENKKDDTSVERTQKQQAADRGMDKLDAILSDMKIGQCGVEGCKGKVHNLTPFNCSNCRQDFCAQHKHPMSHQCAELQSHRSGHLRSGLNTANTTGHLKENMTKRDKEVLDVKYQAALNNKNLTGIHGRKQEDDKNEKKQKKK